MYAELGAESRRRSICLLTDTGTDEFCVSINTVVVEDTSEGRAVAASRDLVIRFCANTPGL